MSADGSRSAAKSADSETPTDDSAERTGRQIVRFGPGAFGDQLAHQLGRSVQFVQQQGSQRWRRKQQCDPGSYVRSLGLRDRRAEHLVEGGPQGAHRT